MRSGLGKGGGGGGGKETTTRKKELQFSDVINARDQNGVTPLMRACALPSHQKAIGVTRVFVEFGADLNAADK